MNVPLLPLAGLLLLCATATLAAQTPIGTVAASTATVSGTLSLTDGKAALGANAVVTARDLPARVQLTRGGEILVCSTSALHLARGNSSADPVPLLLALDRGAVELHMPLSAADAILTPDLRLTIQPQTASFALIDLTLRVAGNGDTCVDNGGTHAPTLQVTEQFGSGLYLIRPGQHLLFEHGSLREVVDHETSPCGCPPPPTASVADNAHPFPAAESQGLAPAEPAAAAVPQAPAHEPHAQVAATLGFSGTGDSFDGTGLTPAQPTATAATPAQPPAATAPQPPPAAPTHTSVFGKIGGFFRHVFGG